MDGVLQYLYNNLFECKICGARFSNKVHLGDHEKTHPEIAFQKDNLDSLAEDNPSNEQPSESSGVGLNVNADFETERHDNGQEEEHYSMKSLNRNDEDSAVERVKLYLNALREKQREEEEATQRVWNALREKQRQELEAAQNVTIKQEVDRGYGDGPTTSGLQINDKELYHDRMVIKEIINGEYVEFNPTSIRNKQEHDNSFSGMEESHGVIKQKQMFPIYKANPSAISAKKRKLETSNDSTNEGTNPEAGTVDINGTIQTEQSSLDPVDFFNKIREQVYGKNIITTPERKNSKSNDSPKDKPYKCDRCGHAFSQKYKLDRHYRTHTGERPYKCDICGAAFSQKGVLVNHQRLHTGDKPYKCEICGANFSVKGYLIKHHRTHTGEKPFKCDSCDAVFSDRGNLSKHRKIHTGEKPYKCEMCTAAFSDRSTLMKHNRIHTDGKQYKCEFCHASFAMKSALTTHKKVHLDDTQHKCNVCNAEFSARGYLIRHMRSHSGEKQYIPSTMKTHGGNNYEPLMETESDRYSMVSEGNNGSFAGGVYSEMESDGCSMVMEGRDKSSEALIQNAQEIYKEMTEEMNKNYTDSSYVEKGNDTGLVEERNVDSTNEGSLIKRVYDISSMADGVNDERDRDFALIKRENEIPNILEEGRNDNFRDSARIDQTGDTSMADGVNDDRENEIPNIAQVGRNDNFTDSARIDQTGDNTSSDLVNENENTNESKTVMENESLE